MVLLHSAKNGSFALNCRNKSGHINKRAFSQKMPIKIGKFRTFVTILAVVLVIPKDVQHFYEYI